MLKREKVQVTHLSALVKNLCEDAVDILNP